MKKPKILYIIVVFLLIVIFSNRSYNVGEPSFFVPVIIVSLVIGVIGVYLFGKDMRLYKNLYFLSYVITIGAAFVPIIGVNMEESNLSYGFPAQWFDYYHLSGSVSFHLFGFLFNFFIFYFVLRFSSKTFLRFSKSETNWNNV
ncbi:hypothetical protein GH741_11325 [Aquibacillus halophilus]|uniref:Uncharacterized protein n=1 Tax=Aquibacillus halophilus TaxID=930132 RepID=A0A6A8DHR9_9BACI|nr:hypothetical protein [Aquibacillus halophilus]MRH43271.1 hypothetical protein [Aquibacillus halophilus]